MQTPEQIATEVVNGFIGDEYWIDKPSSIDAVAAALRAFADQERMRAIQVVTRQANALPADVDDGFYAGYKLAIRNALAAIRQPGAETPGGGK